MKTWISVALLAFVCFFQKGECAISAWTVPVIATPDGDNAPLTTNINSKVSVVTGTLTITATPGTGNAVYNLVSQAPTGGNNPVFAVASASGDITITSGTTNFATSATYEFIVTAADDDNIAVTATVTLSVNDNPAFSAQQQLICVANGAASSTVVATLTAATSTSTGTNVYAIGSGNTPAHWSMAAATGAISTTRVTDQTTYIGYILEVTATQGALIGTSTVVLAIGCSSGATTVLAGCITLLMTLIAHLY